MSSVRKLSGNSSSKLRRTLVSEVERNSFKIDHQEEKPSPDRSNEPVGIGLGAQARSTAERENHQGIFLPQDNPDVFEVDPCSSSDSEPEIIFVKSTIKREPGKNNVIEVNIDSDSEGEFSSRSQHDDYRSRTSGSDHSSSRSSSVIQIGSSDMEEDCKFNFENDIEMVDTEEPDQDKQVWGTTHDENQDIICVSENADQDENPFVVPESKNCENSAPAAELPGLVDADAVPAASYETVADERKRLGNEYFKNGDYHNAQKMYTAAIEVMPTEATYFGNRSACFMMLNKFRDAAEDAKSAITLDPNFKNAYQRLVRSTLALGDITSCDAALKAVTSNPNIALDLSDEQRKLQQLIKLKQSITEELTKNKDYRRVLFLTERAKDIAVGDVTLKIKKAESLIKLGRLVEAQEQCTEILQSDGMVLEAITLRAFCFYQSDNLEKAMQCYATCCQLAPDNQSAVTDYKKIKKIKELREAGATKFKQQNWIEAKVTYLEVLELIDNENPTLESKINFNLALITGKNNVDDSLIFVNKALSLNPNYVKALLHRATILTSKEDYDSAVQDYTAAEKLDPNTKDIRKLIENAKLAAKKAKRKDYYKILGIDKKASTDEIKKAYKKRALVHHPDRHANASETERKDQERKFKEVLEAYEILLDDKKRRRYDLGLDVTDAGSPSYETFDPSAMFGHMFFQQAGMGGMGGGRPGGFYQFRSGPGYSGFRR